MKRCLTTAGLATVLVAGVPATADAKRCSEHIPHIDRLYASGTSCVNARSIARAWLKRSKCQPGSGCSFRLGHVWDCYGFPDSPVLRCRQRPYSLGKPLVDFRYRS